MTPREILLTNGDFAKSPLLDTLHRVDSYLKGEGIPYAVVGGMAVIRNGAPRTTLDLDLLIESSDWMKVRDSPPGFLQVELDSAVDRENGTEIDVLHPGDEWEMEVPLPHPADIGEEDEELGGIFAGLLPLLIIKCAVYRSKLAADGIEIASKDLYDLSELLKVNEDSLNESDFTGMPEAIADELKRILRKVSNHHPN